MARLTWTLPLLALLGCPSDPAKDSGGGDDTDTNTGGCTVTIDETIPVDGSVDAYYRGDIEFHLSDADTTASIDTTIPGSMEVLEDGKTIIWRISQPLDCQTFYEATLNYCGGAATIGFQTSDLGCAPSVDTFQGNTYALNLADARIVDPPGIGSVLTTYLTTQILMGVVSDEGTDLQMLGAVALEDSTNQDYCNPTIDFPVADFTDRPFFSIGPQDTTFEVAGYSIPIQGLNITGTFAPDGSYIGGATLAGTIDTRPLAPLLDDSGDEGAICELAVNFGAECEPCPSDGKSFCLTLYADQIYADQVSGELTEVLGSDCAGCESGPPDPETCSG